MLKYINTLILVTAFTAVGYASNADLNFDSTCKISNEMSDCVDSEADDILWKKTVSSQATGYSKNACYQMVHAHFNAQIQNLKVACEKDQGNLVCEQDKVDRGGGPSSRPVIRRKISYWRCSETDVCRCING